MSEIIDIIMSELYEKSNREVSHSKRVSELCISISTNMNFNDADINQIRIAGLVHDIGKIGMDERILNKPGKLNNNEFNEIKRHPEIGYRIINTIEEFLGIANIVLEHQEKWDGSGYPRNLKGKEISLQARIISVADAYDAMTSQRTYGKVLSKEEAINEIQRYSGTQFDPDISRMFIKKVLKKSF